MLKVNRNALNIQANNVQVNDNHDLLKGGVGGGNQALKQSSKTPSPPLLKSCPFENNDELDFKKGRLFSTNAVTSSIDLSSTTTATNTTTATQNKPITQDAPDKRQTLQVLKPLLTKQVNQQQSVLQQKRVSRIPKPISNINTNKSSVEKLKAVEECPIEDIDQYTGREAAFLVCDVAKDIYQYMFDLEAAQAVERDYLRNQKIFTPKIRQRLVNWCLEIHGKLDLLQETLYIAVSIIDRYFNKVTVRHQSQVQLIAAGAFLIASKYEEIYPPELNDLIILTSNAYSRRDIMRAEIEILEQLNFDLGKPIPLAFLRRFSKAAHCDLKMHSIAKFLMELSLTEYECCHWAPSLLAATALYITIHVVQHQHENQPSLTTTNTLASYGLTKQQRLGSSALSTTAQQQSLPASQWNKQLVHYTHYSREHLEGPAAILCKILKRFLKSPANFTSYKRNQANLIRWPELKSARVDELIKLGEQ